MHNIFLKIYLRSLPTRVGNTKFANFPFGGTLICRILPTKTFDATKVAQLFLYDRFAPTKSASLVGGFIMGKLLNIAATHCFTRVS